jgi:hypothetical protein
MPKPCFLTADGRGWTQIKAEETRGRGAGNAEPELGTHKTIL